jgi:cytochrome c-type biogenesis protein CcmH
VRALTAVALLVVAGIGVAAGAPAAGTAVDEEQVREIGAQLRCVVCQSMSVADSPSETAHQMREIIRERLAAGDNPEQVKAYFVDKYGLWILLAPPRQGFNLLVWIVPFAGLGIGLVLVAVLVRRWSRQARASGPPAGPVDSAMHERLKREMSERES